MNENIMGFHNIPKIIHYCWFGHNPLPPLAERCIASWKKYFLDYEIREWNETNFNIDIIPYTQQAYRAKKYAFVSDYARFWVLYHWGGVYFDTDVEVIRPMEPILEKGAFMGCEQKDDREWQGIAVAPGLGMAAPPHLNMYRELLELYSQLVFTNSDGSLNMETVVKHTTGLLVQKGLKDIDGIQQLEEITIYPPEYFCPQSYYTGRLDITTNTYSIHHYSSSWRSNRDKIIDMLVRVFGKGFVLWVGKFIK